MGGAQFALPGAVERLRASPGIDRGEATESERTLVLAAVDPAQPYGAALPWPRRQAGQSRPSRVAGAYLALVEDEPAVYVERGGRGLITLAPGVRDAAAVHAGLDALARAVRAGRVPKLALERIDGEPAISSPLADALVALGFAQGPRRLTLTA
jgi:ATP-dependent Lhr-like helicase